MLLLMSLLMGPSESQVSLVTLSCWDALVSLTVNVDVTVNGAIIESGRSGHPLLLGYIGLSHC